MKKISLIRLIIVSFFSFFLHGCNDYYKINGIYPIGLSENHLFFALSYSLANESPYDYFIKAGIPDLNNPNNQFYCKPAGLPDGIPKGEHESVDNIGFEMEYFGNNDYQSYSIELGIYDNKRGHLLYRKKFDFNHLWKATQISNPHSITSNSIGMQSSIYCSNTDDYQRDMDRDGLKDNIENQLAELICPFLIFDSDEGARQDNEPVILFQVTPMNIDTTIPLKVIQITYCFLFRRDGGYGPDSWCKNAHEGDNQTINFRLWSLDEGITWTINSISGVVWFWCSPISFYNVYHPVLYMSAHKHHIYFNTDYDHKNSLYSEWGCNEDVNGNGVKVRGDIFSINEISYNNVGEFDIHPSPPFINRIGYSNYTAWDERHFYSNDCSRMVDAWKK